MLNNEEDVLLARCEEVARYRGKEDRRRWVDGSLSGAEVDKRRQSTALLLTCVVLGPTAPIDDKAVAVYDALTSAFRRGQGGCDLG